MRISDWSSDVCSSDLERIDTPVTGAPKHKLDVAARYVIEAGPDIGDFVLAGNGSYQSKINISDDALFSATSREQQKGYVLANLRIDWNTVMGNPIDASLFVYNLLDKTFTIGSGNMLTTPMGTTHVSYGDPQRKGAVKGRG